MGISGDDFLTPVMYQDLASASMQPMPMIGMSGRIGNTNLLGGVKMQEDLDKDRFQAMQDKEKKDMNLLKKAGIAILVLAGLGFVKFAPIKKWISAKFTKVSNWCKNLFKSKPPTPAPPAPTAPPVPLPSTPPPPPVPSGPSVP